MLQSCCDLLCLFFLAEAGTLVEFIHTSNTSLPPVCSFSLAGCADLNSLDTLSPQEKKRQGYIHELIETEERYVEDLQIVLEVMEECPA